MQHEPVDERCRGGFFALLIFAAATTMLALGMLVAPPEAQAQDQFDCASFDSQQEAQAELERDPSDPSNLDADNDGRACEDYPYDNSGGGSGGGGDLDCADFPSQAAAQRELEKDLSDPNNLDADDDGQACEVFDYSSSGAGGTSGNDQYGGGRAVARGAADHQYGRAAVIGKSIPHKGALSNTGGAPLSLLFGTVLLSTGLLLRRRGL
jgi:hypothetical protein